jgi:hypothetical protein
LGIHARSFLNAGSLRKENFAIPPTQPFYLCSGPIDRVPVRIASKGEIGSFSATERVIELAMLETIR